MRPITNVRRARPAGFTLAEVLVAVPLLVLVFWIIGTIFVTTRDTVNLGMVHAKVTATAESAVQRMARDLMGLRSDGRLVVVAYRTPVQSVSRDDAAVAAQVPGAYGHLAFISQLTALSQTTGSTRANVARIIYRPAQRMSTDRHADQTTGHAIVPIPYWDSQAMIREALLYVYDPTRTRAPNTPEIPFLLQNDVLGFPSTQITVGTGTVAQPRSDLVQQAIESFRTRTYADGTARVENYGGVFPFDAGNVPLMYPSPTNALQLQAFYQRLMLPRCALVYNGTTVPPAPAATPALQPLKYPRGVLNPDPNTEVAKQDPGATAFFQWWGQDLPTDLDAAGRPLRNWHPNSSEVPESATYPAAYNTGTGFYYRKFMYIKTAEDVLEYQNQAPYNLVPPGGTNYNRAPNGPAAERVPWPDAIRVNMMLFDKVGRFRAGALFQAVVDLPSSR